jgi:signal transduction histidine kinase
MENQLTIALSKNKLLKNADISKINLSGFKGKLITASEGEIIYREGDNSSTVFLVISGEINVIKKRLLGKTKSYVFLENDFFGNEEYFEETSRTSTAVALRDSYLIALTNDEIENLVNQEHQIYLNLREPVEETLDDIIKSAIKDSSAKKNESQQEYSEIEKDPFGNELGFKEQAEQSDNDFFQSIADVSRSDDADIIKSIEKNISEETTKNDFELLSFEDDETTDAGNLENKSIETDIPQPEDDLQNVENEEEKSEKIETQFDESVYLNEDGIPKAEFEIPDSSGEQESFVRKSNGLDDALFNILSGGTQFESAKSDTFDISANKSNKENEPEEKDNPSGDEDFFAAFSSDKFEVPEMNENVSSNKSDTDNSGLKSENKFDIIKGTQTRAQVKPETSEAQEQNVKAQPYKKHFDSDDIIAEAEEKIRKVERGEPVSSSDNWRTIGDAGGEMTSDQLQMIIKAAEFVNSTVKIDEVLANVVEVATSLTNADRGTLFLIDREKGELWSLIAMGNESKEIRLKIGEGLAGYVALSGEIINIKDVQKDPRFRSDFDKASGYKTKNMLCYPIKNNKQEIIGVLQLLNSRNDEFSKLDENFLNAISIHSAIALQNAAMVDKLLQSERVQSLGKMANFLIQDIKKPVLVSRRYAEHLKTKNLSQDVTQVVDMLLEQLNQVADLVQTTSSYAETKPLMRTLNVSLNKTLADYIIRITSFIETRNCQISSEYDKDVTVKLDVKEFYQCFVHIIKNACDAMPEGGTIHISTKRDDRHIKLSFQDNGLGIPDGFKEKIFEPFMSYGKKEGTGLGLSITKKVVEAHNGTIEVQSSLGAGATFMITLPVAAAF